MCVKYTTWTSYEGRDILANGFKKDAPKPIFVMQISRLYAPSVGGKFIYINRLYNPHGPISAK